MVDKMLQLRSNARNRSASVLSSSSSSSLLAALQPSERTVHVVGYFGVPLARSSDISICWFGVIDTKKEAILRALPDNVLFELDFNGYSTCGHGSDYCISARGLELKSWYKRMDEDPATLAKMHRWYEISKQQYFGTVNFPAALSDALKQRCEEVAEDKATRKFERDVAEAEARGEVYDDGCGGIDVTVSDDDDDDDDSSGSSADGDADDIVVTQPDDAAAPASGKSDAATKAKTLEDALFADD